MTDDSHNGGRGGGRRRRPPSPLLPCSLVNQDSAAPNTGGFSMLLLFDTHVGGSVTDFIPLNPTSVSVIRLHLH